MRRIAGSTASPGATKSQAPPVSEASRRKWPVGPRIKKSLQEARTTAQATIERGNPLSVTTVTSGIVTTSAEALQSILADDERATKMSLSKSARFMALQAERATLAQAPDVLAASKVSSLVHKWDSEPSRQCSISNVTIVDGCVVVQQQTHE